MVLVDVGAVSEDVVGIPIRRNRSRGDTLYLVVKLCGVVHLGSVAGVHPHFGLVEGVLIARVALCIEREAVAQTFEERKINLCSEHAVDIVSVLVVDTIEVRVGHTAVHTRTPQRAQRIAVGVRVGPRGILGVVALHGLPREGRIPLGVSERSSNTPLAPAEVIGL